MGQDQSKTEGPPLRPNPKFQRAQARTTALSPTPTYVLRPNLQDDETILSSSLPNTIRQPDISVNDGTRVTLENNQTPSTVNNDNVNASEMKNTDGINMDPSTQSSTLAENLALDHIKENYVREELSTTAQSPRVTNDISISKFKSISVSDQFSRPERDIRHVPTYKEQIKLNSTSEGNPFLSNTSDNEFGFSVQTNPEDNFIVPVSKYCKINERLEEMYKSGILGRFDLDKLAIDTLDKLPLNDALDVLHQFYTSNPRTKINKSAYLCSMIKHRLNGKNMIDSDVLGHDPRGNSLLKHTLSMPSTSQNKSPLYFNQMYTSPAKSTSIIDEDRLTDINSKQNSPISVAHETPINNPSPSKYFTVEKGSVNDRQSEQEIFGDLENENLTKENTARHFGQSPSNFNFQREEGDTVRTHKSNLKKTSGQFKRNCSKFGGTRNQSLKTSTNNALKDVEKIAESLCSLNIGSTKLAQNESRFPNINIFDSKDQHKTLSLEDCLVQMKNDSQPEKELTLLLQSLFCNLKTIDNFITCLKSFPFLNDQLISQIIMLKENISSFSTNLERSPFFDDVDLSFNEGNKTCVNPEKSQPLSTVENENLNYVNPGLILSLSNIPPATFENSDCKGQSPVALTTKGINQLGENHQGLLNVMFSSLQKDCEFNKIIYICIPCDYFNSDKSIILHHVGQHKVEKGNFHSCNNCNMVIFGTDVDFQTHCLSEQHCNITRMKMNNTILHKDMTNELEEEMDDVSVCSSNGGRKKPHEILLLIAKQCKNKNKTNGPLALYCRICNRYFKFHASSQAYASRRHIQVHYRDNADRRRYQLFSCVTCNVDLFGDQSLWEEHENMDLHKELARGCEQNITQKTDYVNKGNESQTLSNEQGPHYELMKEVLMLHLKNDLNKDTFGYYCHFCAFYSLDENQWQTHVSSASHSNHVSSFVARRKLLHICSLCKVHLYCEDNVFILHEKSLAHDALSKLFKSRNDLIGAELVNSEEPVDDENSEEEDDDDDDEENSNPTTCSNQDTNYENLEKTKRLEIGIKISGIKEK